MLKTGPQLKYIVQMKRILYGELAQEKQPYYAKKRSLAQTHRVNGQHTGWRSSSRKHTILYYKYVLSSNTLCQWTACSMES